MDQKNSSPPSASTFLQNRQRTAPKLHSDHFATQTRVIWDLKGRIRPIGDWSKLCFCPPVQRCNRGAVKLPYVKSAYMICMVRGISRVGYGGRKTALLQSSKICAPKIAFCFNGGLFGKRRHQTVRSFRWWRVSLIRALSASLVQSWRHHKRRLHRLSVGRLVRRLFVGKTTHVMGL